MSPTLLRRLRMIEAETRRLAMTPHYDADGWALPDTARYPRDYYRAAELVRVWRGLARSRFYYPEESW